MNAQLKVLFIWLLIFFGSFTVAGFLAWAFQANWLISLAIVATLTGWGMLTRTKLWSEAVEIYKEEAKKEKIRWGKFFLWFFPIFLGSYGICFVLLLILHLALRLSEGWVIFVAIGLPPFLTLGLMLALRRQYIKT